MIQWSGKTLSQCEAAGNSSRGRASTSLKHRGHDKAREVGGTEHSASWGRGGGSLDSL